MSKTDIYKVVFSSIFFLLFVFTILALLVSQFSDTFSQLFLILTRDDRAYDNLVRFFYFCGILLSLGYLIASTWSSKDASIQQLVSMGIFIVLIFVFVLSLSSHKTLDSTIIRMINKDELRNLSLGAVISANIVSIVISGFFYLFFLVLPLALFGFGYRINVKNKLGRYLDFFCPSINICIVILFASGLQAYYDKSNAFLYIDFFMFCLCFILLIRVFLTRKEMFGFYEYANILFFAIGVLVCLFCSNTLSQAENYFNARVAFYALALLGWFGEWMYASLVKQD